MLGGGLILEGGGMRGIYTSGVLDCFLDEGLMFKNIYGVSAGACHAASYISGQRGRSMRTVMDYVGDWRYSSVRSLLTTGDFFGVKMVYDDIPNRLLPFDYEAYERSEAALHAVVTNCRTGEAEYLIPTDLRRETDIIRASSSLPLLSRIVEINGEKYLDGGIADSIPLQRSIDDGNTKNLVVLTRDASYRKKAAGMNALMYARYSAYPQLIGAYKNRHIMYNETLELVAREEEAGRALVIQPLREVVIGRLEKDKQKLRELYVRGYADAKVKCAAIKEMFK